MRGVSLICPCTPTKIIGVGINYRSTAKNLGMGIPQEPVVFLKPPSGVVGPYGDIILPKLPIRVDYEVELGVVIANRVRNISSDRAKDYILGYTCANDITAVDMIAPDMPWTLAKGFDTFTPLGPCIATGLNPDRLNLIAHLNGHKTQDGASSDMISKAFDIVAYISRVMTLEPGDVILTGTPPGKGRIKAGDVVECRISGIGSIVNKVVDG